uniref:Calcium-binding protein n=1 Tax=Tritonibacter mobilis F1926 TaxID=1265309 RepID=A0A1B1A5K9_9RHOB|nr:calcium-binding protein [Tritonibacter mobilis]ANP41865.1 hypothetical protein K529_013895 [Tritonibacter mobilis F1926]
MDLTQGAGGASNGESGVVTDGTNTINFSEIERLRTGTGDDSILGSDQDDRIDANAGADTVDAGAGDDIIDLGVYGAADGDADTVILSDGDGNDTISGFDAPTDNGDGTYTGGDQLDVSGLTDAGGNPVNVLDVTVSDTNGDGTGHAVLQFPNGESITLNGVDPGTINTPAALAALGIPAPNYIVEGTSGDDVIGLAYNGDPNGDMVDAGDNIAGNNDDVIHAGAGNDSISSSFGDDSVDAGDGNDSVWGGSGEDTLIGGAGNDTLRGATGDDLLYGGDDDDHLSGEDGNDKLHGGLGNDFLDGNSDNDTIYGDAGNDTLTGDLGDDDLYGGTGSDTIYGDEGDDSLEGGDGNDSLYGGAGSDTLRGGDGDDYLGGSGNAETSSDSLFGDAGNDTLYSGSGFATLDGGDGNDRLYVNSGNTTLKGGTGNDSIHGGTGDDSMMGESGDDSFDLADDFGNDTIIGGETGETNGDTLDLRNITSDLTIDLTSADAEAGSFTDGTSTATFTEIENIRLGRGSDTLVLADGSGADAVQGFDMTDSGDGTTVDQLDVSDLTDADGNPVNVFDVTVADTNGDGTGDAILQFPNGESITLAGVSPSSVNNQAALMSMGIPGPDYIVEGTSGDDLIDVNYTGDPEGDMVDAADNAAGNDDDVIVAGAGDDTIQSGAGSDTVSGGTGNDVLSGGEDDDSLEGGEVPIPSLAMPGTISLSGVVAMTQCMGAMATTAPMAATGMITSRPGTGAILWSVAKAQTVSSAMAAMTISSLVLVTRRWAASETMNSGSTLRCPVPPISQSLAARMAKRTASTPPTTPMAVSAMCSICEEQEIWTSTMTIPIRPGTGSPQKAVGPSTPTMRVNGSASIFPKSRMCLPITLFRAPVAMTGSTQPIQAIPKAT